MTRVEALQALATLRAAFPTQTIPNQTIELYATQLEKYDRSLMVGALERLMAAEKFWPSLAAIGEHYRAAAERHNARARLSHRTPDVPQLEAGPPPTVPREVLEFCANNGMDWARKRLQEAA